MRLIDADKLKAFLNDNYVIYDHSLDDIDAQPTIDAEPVTYAHWIENKGTKCSNCGFTPMSKVIFRGEKIWEIDLTKEYHYCPNCGAKMGYKE